MSTVDYTRPAAHKSSFVSKLTEEALSTHLALERSHIGIAVEVLSMIEFTDIQLAYFILFVSQTCTTGQFALSFNHDIDLAIHQNNVNQLIYLAETDPNEFFVELNDNAELTYTERSTIIMMKEQELQTILKLIDTYNREEYDKILYNRYNNNDSGLSIPESFLHLCPRKDELEVCENIDGKEVCKRVNSTETCTTTDGVTVCTKTTPTYDSCYKEICLLQKRENFFSPTTTSTVKIPSNNILEYGKVEKREIICLPYMQFIKVLTTGENNFAKHLISTLQKQYIKEIKMYSRFLRNKNKDYIFY